MIRGISPSRRTSPRQDVPSARPAASDGREACARPSPRHPAAGRRRRIRFRAKSRPPSRDRHGTSGSTVRRRRGGEGSGVRAERSAAAPGAGARHRSSRRNRRQRQRRPRCSGSTCAYGQNDTRRRSNRRGASSRTRPFPRSYGTLPHDDPASERQISLEEMVMKPAGRREVERPCVAAFPRLQRADLVELWAIAMNVDGVRDDRVRPGIVVDELHLSPRLDAYFGRRNARWPD